MFIAVIPFRPFGNISSLTYQTDSTREEKFSVGDIVEIPMHGKRERAVVIITNVCEPTYTTKNIGKILAKKFFSENFIQFLHNASSYTLQNFSQYLKFSCPKKVQENNFFPPQEKIFIAGKDLNDAKGKKQIEVKEFFENFVETNCSLSLQNLSLSDTERKKLKISPSVLKNMVEKEMIEEKFYAKFPKKNWETTKEIDLKKIFNPPVETNCNLSRQGVSLQEIKILLGSNLSAKNSKIFSEIGKTLLENKQVLFLLPDSSSLAQIEEKFSKIFPENFFTTWESGMGTVGLSENFWKIYSGHSKIILGTKNALFLPFQNLGKISIHEYPDPIYISNLSSPYFSAIDIAKIRAKTENIPLILSGTTGDIEEIYASLARNKKGEEKKIFPFPDTKKLKIHIVDMNAENMNGNFSSLSAHLEHSISVALQEKKQVLLFVNRRGMHRIFTCVECGWFPTSPLSGERLSIFKGKNGEDILRCNTSGYQEDIPKNCPLCNSEKILKKSLGTQKGEEDIQKKFPNARIGRIDSDAIDSRKKARDMMEKISSRGIDIIIGTQMVLRPFPFDNIAVIASLQTENDFMFPSYQAEEKGFWQMMRLMDMGGKNICEAEFFLQTFLPNHPLISNIAEKNFSTIYQKEISTRKLLLFPPFSEKISLLKRGKNKEKIVQDIAKIEKILQPYILKKFPIEISFHPHRKIFITKTQYFFRLGSLEKIEKKRDEKIFSGVIWNRY